MARLFDAASEKIDWGDQDIFDTLQKLTVSFWITKNGSRSFGHYVAKSASSVGWDILTAGTGANIRFAIEAERADTTGNPLTLSVEHHVWLVYDGTQATNTDRIKIWVDGTSQSLGFSGTIATSTGNPAVALTLGATGSGGDAQDMDLSEVAIWVEQAITTQATIDDIAAGGCVMSIGNDPDGLYAPLQGTDSPEIDHSVNEFSGTVTGATQTTHPSIDTCPPSGTSIPVISNAYFMRRTDF